MIAVTTPITIIAGLAYLRLRNLQSLFVLACSNIAAIGVSSSGLILCVFTTLLIIMAGFLQIQRTTLFSLIKISATLALPFVFLLYLKFVYQPEVSMHDIGSALPISVSTGGNIRTSVIFALFLLGSIQFRRTLWGKEYLLVVAGTLVVVLNPWFTEFVADVSARNMSWRLAWASPVPLLAGVGAAAMIGPVFQWPVFQKKQVMMSAFVGVLLLTVFMGSGRWTLAEKTEQTGNYLTINCPMNFILQRRWRAFWKV